MRVRVMDGQTYSRWLAAQDWIDAAEREARLTYWQKRLEFERRVQRFLKDVAEGGRDDDK